MLRTAGKYNQPQRRRRGAETGREKLDLPTEPNSSPMRFCSSLDGRYSEAYKPRSRGDPAPSPQQYGTEGKDKPSATQEWETRKKDVEHAGKSRRGKD